MSLSPAERYAAAKSRSDQTRTLLHAFKSLIPFVLDDFQDRACQEIEKGKAVLVAAPTSAGKTVVGEFAIHLALSQGTKCFYTTPIKALSNQKFQELVARYGADQVGLLTGDNSINGEAPVVVMTTEVLRNMIYESSRTLDALSHVVMDEVHYLADRNRGAVWEEVIIHLPDRVRVVALSATVSNAEEFGEWLRAVRGDTSIIVEELRPVPLHQHVVVGDELVDLLVGDDKRVVNPDLLRIARNDRHATRTSGARRGRGAQSRYSPSRVSVIANLEEQGLLPCINFVFSRNGCDDAVSQILASGLNLVSRSEQLEIRGIVDQACADLPDDDLRVLGFETWRNALERGVAAHHAGMLPLFKETVETLFQRGLVKVVFATETLALGINMPARSVVLEKLTKWNGETHVEVTPGEYTQLTGRAGRRGIDIEGHAIVVWHTGLDPQSLAGLAQTRTYPLKSSFKPSYNMAINLISRVGAVEAREILGRSFAQFQADKAVVGLTTQVKRNEAQMSELAAAAQCHLGDFFEYMQLRKELSAIEKSTSREENRRRKFAGINLLGQARRGDVIWIGGAKSRALNLVLDEARDTQDPRPRVIDQNGDVRRIGVHDLADDAHTITRVRLPNVYDTRSPKSRQVLIRELDKVGRSHAQQLASIKSNRSGNADDAMSSMRRQIRNHVCHGCSDRESHVAWYERWYALQDDNFNISRKVNRRTNSISAAFDRICEVLHELGYLSMVNDEYQVTEHGRMLGRIYGELDLLAAQCLMHNIWADLAEGNLAAAVSGLVYEARRDDAPGLPSINALDLNEAVTLTISTWGTLKDVEHQHQVEMLREPDFGFLWPSYRWANGQSVARALRNSDLAPGDFVRWSKQVIDLLGQISAAALDPVVAQRARACAETMNRGIVAW